MAKAKQTVEAEVREHLSSTPDYPKWLAVVTTSRGRCYSATYAGEQPSTDKVLQDWLDDRGTSRAKNWSPYHS